MLQEERLLKIIEFVREKGSARFSEVAAFLGVSEGTARKDLMELDRRKAVKLVRGGVVWGKRDITREGPQMRDIIYKDQKQELVRCLADIVEDGQAIAMNGGTTTVEAARFLAENYDRLTIVTNNLTILEIFRDKKDFQLILAGGMYCIDENTVVGKQVEKDVAMYNTDLAILAVNSISVEKGITDFRMEESSVINAMIRSSRKAVIVADHSKFDRVSCVNVCPLDKLHYIITDSEADQEVLEKYRKAGVSIIMPE